MKFRVVVKTTKVVEVEAQDEAQAREIGRARIEEWATPVQSVSVFARWVDAFDVAAELVEGWREAGEPEDDSSTHYGQAEYQADGVKKWAIGQGTWPMDQVEASSVWYEICDILED